MLRCALLVAAAAPAVGHGFMINPPSRNYLAWVKGGANAEDCPHCLNGGYGGSGTTADVEAKTLEFLGTGDWPYPHTDATEVRRGACGESAFVAPSDRVYETAGGATVLKAGTELVIDATITAHHKGHLEARLCKVDDCSQAGAPPQSCFNLSPLLRVDGEHAVAGGLNNIDYDPTAGGGTGNGALLAEVELSADNCPAKEGQGSRLGSAFADESYDPALTPCFPERAYLRTKKNMAKSSGGDDDYRGWKLKWTVQLPADLPQCEHCVVQWYYATSNTCVQPGYRVPGAGHQELLDDYGATSFGMENCGNPGANYPEEFWNCADVAIVDPATWDALAANAPCITSGKKRVATPCTSRDFSRADEALGGPGVEAPVGGFDLSGLAAVASMASDPNVCSDPEPGPVPAPEPSTCADLGSSCKNMPCCKGQGACTGRGKNKKCTSNGAAAEGVVAAAAGTPDGGGCGGPGAGWVGLLAALAVGVLVAAGLGALCGFHLGRRRGPSATPADPTNLPFGGSPTKGERFRAVAMMEPSFGSPCKHQPNEKFE